ncbi:MAG: gliding motility-associated C-terminal domain-containing protein [Bacteroidota bacterium]
MYRMFTVLNRGLLLVFVITGFFHQHARATHAMGSDLTYRCLGGNTYEVTLTIYRDCIGSNLTPQQNIAFYSDSCGVATYILKANRTSITELSPLCPAQQPFSTCKGGPLPGVEEHVYKLTTTLTQSCPDWRLSWQLCCRNYAITNSVITPSTRMYIESFLNNRDVTCNNSPFFTTPPVPYLCNGRPFLFNHGTVDPDGDSLVFELADPRDYVAGNPQDIPYMPGFSVNYPMATNPPNAFNFDTQSGQFSFTPSGLQQGIVTLIVKEYRNGMLIGSTIRDLQMVVINCANVPPNIAPPSNVSGGQLNGNTFSVCAGSTLSFDIVSNDLNVQDILTILTTIGTALPPTVTLNTVGTNPVTASFSWPTTTADIGNYFFSFTAEDNGCPFVGRQTVGYNIIVQTGEILPPQQVKICPVTTTNVQLSTTIPNPGGVGTYSWSPANGLSNPNIPNPVASVDSATTYTVTYQAPGGCPIVEPVEIITEGQLEVLADSVRICQGDSIQLEANFTLNGPPVPFTYTWDPPATLSDPTIANPIAFPNTTTLYSVTASTLTCGFTKTVLVEVDTSINLAPMTDQAICVGDSVQLNPTGVGVGQATYQWLPILGLSNPNIRQPMASPTNATTYTLFVTNACGADTGDVTVSVNAPLIVNTSIIDVSCNGANNGSITAVPLGGGGNATYSWTPNVGNTSTVSNLAPGTYVVSVTDASNCTGTDTAIVSEPPPLVLNIDTTINILCVGEASGSITVSATGGTPGYQYSIDGTTWLNLNTFNSLAVGTYTLSVRDSNNCIATSAPITLTEPALPLVGLVVSKVNTDCNNQAGEIYLGGTGGVAPYVFSIDGITYDSLGQYVALAPGTYIGRVRDANGCEDLVNVDIIDIADPYLDIDTIGAVTCYGGNDGFISLNGFSGTPPYLYSFNNGPLDTLNAFSGLVAGDYSVILEDSIGCRYTLNFQITQPDSLFVVVGAQQDVDCNGNTNGYILALAAGGIAPYQYSIDGVNFASDSLFDNLPANNYTISVLDSNNCPASVNTVLAEPQVLTALVADKRDVLCTGGFDGYVVLDATGGTPAYEYSIDGIHFFATDSFPGLAAGNYTFYAMDAQGCVDSILVNILEPGPLSLQIGTVTDARCFGTATGSIAVQGVGGVPPYLYSADQGRTYETTSVLNNLAKGLYTVLVLDANGCLAEASTSINEPPDLIGEIEPIQIPCFGDSNGRAEARVIGGVAPYQYDWSNGATGFSISNLGPGNYIALITDDNNCQISISTEIIEPPLMEFDTTMQMDVTCFGGSDGMALSSVSGGVPPYTYYWNAQPSNDSALLDIVAGTYRLEVVDSNNCAIYDTFDIRQPDELIIEVVESEDSYCDLPNGSILVQASGGVPGYNYVWNTSPPQFGNLAVNLLGSPLGGPYQVVVTDSALCTDSVTIDIQAEPLPVAAFTTDFAPADSFIVKVSKGVQFINQSQNAITYFWDFGDGGISYDVDPKHIYEGEGFYRVMLVAYDENQTCPDTAFLGFTLLPPGAIYVPNAFTPNEDGINEGFHPKGIGVVYMKMDIFDRWGKHLWTLNSMDEKWPGLNQNMNPVQEGVYVWKMHAILNDGTDIRRAGTVTLLR